MNVLGNTIKEIALNKLGVVKENVPFVTIENEEINELVKEVCDKNNSKYTIVSKKDIFIKSLDLNQTLFDYKEFKNIKLKMLGAYQAENACIAIEAVKCLIEQGYNITNANIINGLNNAFWLGRLEVVNEKPLIILDGAHNVDAFNRLVEFIKEVKKNNKIRLILAISANKDKENMLSMLDESLIDELILTSFAYKRSDDASNLFNMTKHSNKFLIESNEDIIEIIKKDSCENIINIFSGSLYFVSELRKIFNS
jgi:dihydrofolate synthase/folylpolyglutamate synthase